MMPSINNLFDALPAVSHGEVFENLLDTGQVRIERIVSHQHASPEQGWYDQAHDEWVLLMAGGAAIGFEADAREHVLKPGDYLHIPAHRRHRVLWTDSKEPTVWLAIHFPSAETES